MIQDRIFAFIGTGNMGGALASAVRKAVAGECIWLCNRTPEKARRLAEALDARVTDNLSAAKGADFLFLGVKPHMAPGVLSELGPILAERPGCVLVSMAAGLSIAALREMAGCNLPVIRINPNTPCAVGAGVVMMAADGVDDATLEIFKTAMAGAGLLDPIDEGLIDAAAALAGCGPAFAAMFIEALADGAVACGLPRAKATAYAAQTLAGTAALCMQTGQHPGALKDAVCSPGGTTIQGVRALERGGFRSAAMEAVIAAYEKTLALARRK